MAERIADNAELLVDEMKRKARRRLVGAIVLALAAAIVLPLLLEKEPRPLGDDVSVQIPPVDEGKFVNRLTGKTGDAKALPKTGEQTDRRRAGQIRSRRPTLRPNRRPASPPAPPPAAATDARAEESGVRSRAARVDAFPNSAPKADATVAAAPEAKSESKPAPKAETKSAPSTEPSSDPKPAIAAANPAPAAMPEAASRVIRRGAAKADGFVVQLAAFADDKGANALANKLKKSGYAAYVEPVNTSRGTLWRVRVGGYASRPEADAARVALKGEGYSGIIAPSQ